MPNWVHKQTKKYMSKDFVTVDLVKGNTQKTAATVEVKSFFFFSFFEIIFFFYFN
jgi:hypothetical protein